ncbi:MAG: cell wall-binding protein [Eubacteriales bacterium]|nr:cell wall-binding protein [Eubacteriales bacterium]
MMKKTLKTLIIAAGFAVMGAMTAAAANGWVQENGQWVYYDQDSKVYNEWKQSADGNWYYLGNNGYMSVNSFVDGDERFVGSDGRMVVNAWRQINSKWYYFDSNGRLSRSRAKQIDGSWYYFDDDGSMQTGWVEDDDNYYYYDTSSGKRLTNTWKRLEPVEDAEDDEEGGPQETDGTYWFYFQSSGKAAAASGSGNYKELTINGNRYCFDWYGRMMTGWVKLDDKTPVIAGYKYFNDTESIGTYGAAHVGWLSAYAPEDETGFSSDVEWYYFDSKGTPTYGTNISDSDDDETLQAKFKKLQKNGKTQTYLFNEYGNPVYGLRKVKKSGGDVTSMYFGTKQESCLQLGDKNITDADGVTSQFFFDTRGYGATGVKNGKLYYMGKLQKAEDDSYAYFTVNGKTYLVNRSGQVKKNYNKNKDADEVDYRSNANGERDGGTASESELLEPAFVTSEN